MHCNFPRTATSVVLATNGSERRPRPHWRAKARKKKKKQKESAAGRKDDQNRPKGKNGLTAQKKKGRKERERSQVGSKRTAEKVSHFGFKESQKAVPEEVSLAFKKQQNLTFMRKLQFKVHQPIA